MSILFLPIVAGRRSFQYDNEQRRNTLGLGAPRFERPTVSDTQQPTRLHGEAGAVDYASYYPLHKLDKPNDERSSLGAGQSRQGRASSNTTGWVRQQRETYFKIEEELKGLKTAETEESSMERNARRAELALSSCKKRLLAAQNAVAKAEKDIDHASRIGFTKRFRKDKYEKEVAEGEAAKHKAQAEVKAFSNEVEELRKQDAEKKRRLGEMQRKVIRKKKLIKQKKQILYNLFAGLDAGDERENQAERRRNQIRTEHSKRKATLVDGMSGLSHITNAVRLLEDVARLLQSALSSNTMDLYTQGNMGFGRFAAQQTLMNMNRAAQLAERANAEMKKAKHFSPHIPIGQEAQVKQSTFGFMQLISDSTFSDMRQRYKIQKQSQKLQVVYRQALQAMKWQEKFVNEIRKDFRKVEAELQQAEQDLMTHRIRLINLPLPCEEREG